MVMVDGVSMTSAQARMLLQVYTCEPSPAPCPAANGYEEMTLRRLGFRKMVRGWRKVRLTPKGRRWIEGWMARTTANATPQDPIAACVDLLRSVCTRAPGAGLEE